MTPPVRKAPAGQSAYRESWMTSRLFAAATAIGILGASAAAQAQIKIGAITGSSYPRKKLEEIITARLSDIFELIEAHLKKMNRNGLLPAGIIITGGGSDLHSIDDIARAALRLPSRIGSVIGLEGKQSFKDATWAVAYGLCILGAHADEGPDIDSSSRFLKHSWKAGARWLKQFLP